MGGGGGGGGAKSLTAKEHNTLYILYRGLPCKHPCVFVWLSVKFAILGSKYRKNFRACQEFCKKKTGIIRKF